MYAIRLAQPDEYEAVRAFYHRLIDEMQGSPYLPGWKKDVYPDSAMLRAAMEAQTLYVCEIDHAFAAAMIVNGTANDGYRSVHWGIDAAENEVRIVHALGVMPAYQGRGVSNAMVEAFLSLARKAGCKAARLDVLEGNLPAVKLYTRHGFAYVGTVNMFYVDTGWTNYELYELVL